MFRSALAKYVGLKLTDSVIMHFITHYKWIHNIYFEAIIFKNTDSAHLNKSTPMHWSPIAWLHASGGRRDRGQDTIIWDQGSDAFVTVYPTMPLFFSISFSNNPSMAFPRRKAVQLIRSHYARQVDVAARRPLTPVTSTHQHQGTNGVRR